jgi:hypothetical protein
MGRSRIFCYGLAIRRLLNPRVHQGVEIVDEIARTEAHDLYLSWAVSKFISVERVTAMRTILLARNRLWGSPPRENQSVRKNGSSNAQKAAGPSFNEPGIARGRNPDQLRQSPVASPAPQGDTKPRDSNCCWMKLRWQVKGCRLGRHDLGREVWHNRCRYPAEDVPSGSERA